MIPTALLGCGLFLYVALNYLPADVALRLALCFWGALHASKYARFIERNERKIIYFRI